MSIGPKDREQGGSWVHVCVNLEPWPRLRSRGLPGLFGFGVGACTALTGRSRAPLGAPRRAGRRRHPVGSRARPNRRSGPRRRSRAGAIWLARASLAVAGNEARKSASVRVGSVKPLLLATALLGLTRKPAVWVSGSAIGIYGDRGDEEADEQSSVGHDFLSDVGVAWESAARPAARVLGRPSPHGDRIGIRAGRRAPAKLLPVCKMGLGGQLGSGQQYMS